MNTRRNQGFHVSLIAVSTAYQFVMGVRQDDKMTYKDAADKLVEMGCKDILIAADASDVKAAGGYPDYTKGVDFLRAKHPEFESRYGGNRTFTPVAIS